MPSESLVDILPSCLKKNRGKDTRCEGKAEAAPRFHLFALEAPRRLRHHDHRYCDDDIPKGEESALSLLFRTRSFALCSSGGRSALDELCGASGTACAALLLLEPAVCAPDFHGIASQCGCSLRSRRLTDVLTLIGFALRGEAGTRLVDRIELTTSQYRLL